jgi:hypothetical protein
VQYVTVNIEDIQVGDLVYSYDTITGEVSQKEVTDVIVREADHINYLTIVDESENVQVLEVTDSHPFWVVTDEPDLERAARGVVDENGVILYHENVEPGLNGFWVEAKDLREGDVLLGANGELSTVVSNERVECPDGITVYNFTVEGNHNYFVIAQTDEHGQTCTLVHNAESGQPTNQIVLYMNLGQYAGQYDLNAIQAAMNKIMEDYGLNIRFLLILTTSSKKDMAGNLGFMTAKIRGHYVEFKPTGFRLGYTLNKYQSFVYIDQLLGTIFAEKIKNDSDPTLDPVLSDEEIIANILLHEVLYHGLLGYWDNHFFPPEEGTLASTKAFARQPVIIPPSYVKSIGKKWR